MRSATNVGVSERTLSSTTSVFSRILVTEFRAGKLGLATMETPEMVEQELVELERTKEEKANKKQSRDRKRKEAFKARNKRDR